MPRTRLLMSTGNARTRESATHLPIDDSLALNWMRELVPLDEILIPAYQRDIQHSLVRHIVTYFDRRKMEPLKLSRRSDGRLYVIDGRQRLTALRQLGHEHAQLLCIVYEGLSEAEEAFIYTTPQETGARRILRPIDQLRGAAAYGEEEATSIIDAVNRSGLELDAHAPASATNLQAIASCRRIVRRHGIEMLERILHLVQQAYPLTAGIGTKKEVNRSRLNGQILMGFSQFLARYDGKFEENRLIARLREAGIDELRERTGDYRKIVHTGRWEVAVGRAIVHIYNQGRGQHQQLPDWSLTTLPLLQRAEEMHETED